MTTRRMKEANLLLCVRDNVCTLSSPVALFHDNFIPSIPFHYVLPDMDQLTHHQQIQEWGQISFKGRTPNQAADGR